MSVINILALRLNLHLQNRGKTLMLLFGYIKQQKKDLTNRSQNIKIIVAKLFLNVSI